MKKILLILLTVLLCGCNNSNKRTNYNNIKQYNSYPTTPNQQRYIQYNILNRGYNPFPSNPPALEGLYRSILDEYYQNPNRTRKTTIDDAYNEGYEEGYAQGRLDGSNGESHGYGFNDSNSYYDYYHTRYCQGYEEGYNNGYYSGLSDYEDEQEELEEEEEW